LGGLIYFTVLGIIVLVLINFLPLVNFFFLLLFDGCVACIDQVSTKEGRGKLRQNVKAAGAGIRQARTAARQGASQARGAMAQARAGGNLKASLDANFFKASAGSSSTGGFDASNVHLTAQQARSLQRAGRAQRTEMGASGASFGQRLRRMGSHIINLGESSSSSAQEGRSLLKAQADGVSPPASPPARSPEAWA
jgi:hypothetical protein